MSEETVLECLFSRLPKADASVVVPPGDDCAAFNAGHGKLKLVAVDQIVGGKHYFEDGPEEAAPEKVGRKLLARNLSDIAAMGGRPMYCVVSIAAPPRHDENWIQRFYNGILALASEFGVDMIGGDLARTKEEFVASLTIVGEVNAKGVLLRSGAEPGDVLMATGVFGGSLKSGSHLDFMPRVEIGSFLGACGLVNAMIDVSDGPLIDAKRIAKASGLSLELKADAFPCRMDGLSMREVLTDGEDYELLFAVSAENVQVLTEIFPDSAVFLTSVGTFSAGNPGEVTVSGPDSVFEWNEFDHFS